MRTTVRLEDELLTQAKAEAARRHKTLTALMEEGLRLVIARPVTSKRRTKVVLPLSRCKGGTLPGIDLNNTADLLDVMDGLVDPSRR